MYRYLTRPSLAGVVATVALLALGFASILTPGWAANPGKPTVEPSPSEALELKATGTASLDAYHAYLLGLRHLNAIDRWRPDETKKARNAFEKAIALDPEFAVAQARHDTENAAAHDAYLQGSAHYKLLTPQSLAKAVPFFEEAIRLDPNYAQAHAALASLYWDVYQNDWAFDLDMPSTRAESRANEHLEEALKEPTSLAHALQSRMFAAWGFLDEAIAEAEKAVALDANDATALAGLADVSIKVDRPAEGLDYIEQAMRLDPHHPPSYLITFGAAQFGMEQYGDAAATFERAVKRNPDNELPWIYLASSYGHLGRTKDGDAAIEAANDLRAKAGLGDLSLERRSPDWYSPFQGEIDFTRFGGKLAVSGGVLDKIAACHRADSVSRCWN